MRAILPLVYLGLLAGCGNLQLPWADREPRVAVIVDPDGEVTRPEARPAAVTAEGGLGASGRTAAALDRVSAAERGAAQAGAGQSGRLLGDTLASLGAPAETGFWLVTGLVSETTAGRIETESGTSVGVELRPSGREPGAGSQISLSAMRALDLPLTALATLRVFSMR